MKFIRAISLLGGLIALSGCHTFFDPINGAGGGGVGAGTTYHPPVLSCDSNGSVSQVITGGPDELGGTVYALNVPATKDVTLSIPAYQDAAGTARIIVQACQQVGGKCDAEGPLGTTYRVCKNPQIVTQYTGVWVCNPSATDSCQ